MTLFRFHGGGGEGGHADGGGAALPACGGACKTL